MTIKKKLNKQDQLRLLHQLTEPMSTTLYDWFKAYLQEKSLEILTLAYADELGAMLSIPKINSIADILSIVPGQMYVVVSPNYLLFPKTYLSIETNMPKCVKYVRTGNSLKLVETNLINFNKYTYLNLKEKFPRFAKYFGAKVTGKTKTTILREIEKTQKIVDFNIQQYIQAYTSLKDIITTCTSTAQLLDLLPQVEPLLPRINKTASTGLKGITQLNFVRDTLKTGFKITTTVPKTPSKNKSKRKLPVKSSEKGNG